MISEGRFVGDGSWELHIHVTDLQVERVLRVKSDLHIGGVMLKLVEELDIAIDWSDHALWWPKCNMWLTHTRSTLDQYGVTAAAELEFTPMHKTLRVQLPDLRSMDFRVDFSVRTFRAVIELCKQLGIRHPEEMSFSKPITADDIKYNYCEHKKNSARNGHTPPDTNSFIVNKSHDSTNGSLNRSSSSYTTPYHSPNKNPISSPGGTWRHNTSNGLNTFNNTIDNHDGTDEFLTSLANSPTHPPESRKNLVRPKSLLERARMNVGWLDSSLSIMEQGIREFDTLLLRFKFFNFYDLNPKYDAVRINMIYEQAKWAIHNEEIDCTEEEMIMFAALQLQVHLQMSQPQPDTSASGEDDIDRALSELQMTLEGSHINSTPSDITHIPELSGYLKLMKYQISDRAGAAIASSVLVDFGLITKDKMQNVIDKPRRFTLKGFKQYYFVCKDVSLSYYKSAEDATEPVEVLQLHNCEASPDVSIAQQKFGIKLEVPTEDGMTDYILRCSDEDQYAHWMAAIQLAAKGKSLADSSYNTEVKTIQAFLSMQRPAAAPVLNPQSLDIRPEDYMAPRFVRKIKGKAVQRILEAHANVKDLHLIDAKVQFIRAWQGLPDYGIALFLIRQMNQKKEEFLGVAFNRIMFLDSHGDHVKTSRYSTVKAWNVNWEKRHMMIQFEDGNRVFSCLTADCKVVHEFIGGYIFLSMRTKDANQTLNEDLFHKLTCGRF